MNQKAVLSKYTADNGFSNPVFFIDDITAFREMMYRQCSVETEKEMKRKKLEVGQAQNRIAKLDYIFKRLYEDDINGAINHERFLKLFAESEVE